MRFPIGWSKEATQRTVLYPCPQKIHIAQNNQVSNKSIKRRTELYIQNKSARKHAEKVTKINMNRLNCMQIRLEI